MSIVLFQKKKTCLVYEHKRKINSKKQSTKKIERMDKT